MGAALTFMTLLFWLALFMTVLTIWLWVRLIHDLNLLAKLLRKDKLTRLKRVPIQDVPWFFQFLKDMSFKGTMDQSQLSQHRTLVLEIKLKFSLTQIIHTAQRKFF